MSIEKRLQQLEQSISASDASGFGSLPVETRRAVLDAMRRDGVYVDAIRRTLMLKQNGDVDTAAAIETEARAKMRQQITEQFGDWGRKWASRRAAGQFCNQLTARLLLPPILHRRPRGQWKTSAL